MNTKLNISIVLYNPIWQQVEDLTLELLQCQYVHHVYWVDNSPNQRENIPISSQKLHYIFNNHNMGYGAAHNIAIRESIYDDIPFHLVINPDIIVAANDLSTLVQFVLSHAEVGLLVPKVVYPNGQLQYLCKLLPTPLDVFGRRFLPKKWMEKRNQRYELRQSGYNRIMNIPYLSGCFMLFRTKAVQKAKLFDEQFFMYPEDMDLTRRIHRDYLTVFYPHVTITHNHAQASYHSWRMMWIHAINMCKYFNKWGWWHDPERRMFNQMALQDYASSTPDATSR